MSIHFSNDLRGLRGSRVASSVPVRHVSFYRDFGKPFFDSLVVLATSFLVVPLIVVLGALVALDGGSPFYKQKRVGRSGRIFTLWKLRTMVTDADTRLVAYLDANPSARVEWEKNQKLKDDPRVTPIGRLLRKTSLDELPQILNVALGDMSLVGPRPMMVDQESMYPGTSYFILRPGITGLWQISERNDSSFSDRAIYDNDYESKLSFLGDVAIMFKTVRTIFRGTGY